MKRAFTVYYDEEIMELAKVEFGKEFAGDTALARGNVLKDAFEYIVETYNATLTEMEEEWETLGNTKK
jgi:hypothetical protein